MPPKPRILDLRSTDRCNVDCWFCSGKRENTKSPVPDVTANLVTTILSCYPSIKNAWISGCGEATLNPHLPQIIEVLLAGNIDVTIETNGIGLSKLSKTLPWRKIHTRISLNAIDPQSYREITRTNNYYDVISGLSMLRVIRAKVSVSFRVSRKILFKQMTEFLDFAKYYSDVPISIGAIPNWTHGLEGKAVNEWEEHALFDDDNEARRIVKHMREQAVGMDVKIHTWPRFVRRNGPPTGGCSWPFHHIVVDGKGDVRGCCNIIEELEPPPNIYKNMVQSWYDPLMVELRKKVQRGGSEMPKVCWQCIDR